MNHEKVNEYRNESGYVPGEFSEASFQFHDYSLDENHIHVPAWETDENFIQ